MAKPDSLVSIGTLGKEFMTFINGNPTNATSFRGLPKRGLTLMAGETAVFKQTKNGLKFVRKGKR